MKKILPVAAILAFFFGFTGNSAYALGSVNSPEQFKQELARHIHNRDTSFTITYMGDTTNLEMLIQRANDQIMQEDNYTEYNLKSHGYKAIGFNGDMAIQFTYNYRTTKQQEKYVDKKVDQILHKIIRSGMSQDSKEKAIHDYIVQNTQYDTTYKNYTAYDALATGKAVCQGYALLAYKMLNKAGIETKIVEGTAGDQPHAWNLVKIDGYWYNLDCTWDDPLPDIPGRVLYDYYNVTDRQLHKDHFWMMQHPVADTVYGKQYQEIPGYKGNHHIQNAAFKHPVPSPVVAADVQPQPSASADGQAVASDQTNTSDQTKAVLQAVKTIGAQIWLILTLLVNKLVTSLF
ncbi:transglutaminase domain-containing protein [Aneurinibacillus sp. Ricciae_BoGa-3]|uniref:transglutaminase domain-containing protein n=1 Tax=Aneurinibacillus sp. Ricciae_BoGa-3 TaxID=3022697 RepID=UPI00233FCA14|nr:transglutaminase domain-containing protein [Aneurinibacillus sp. Ricciae_BoGa-3]WCK55533.1 transglutaminase domain-containing protein [Aneurinibacillus sp. Ricciae_BoGa-3]